MSFGFLAHPAPHLAWSFFAKYFVSRSLHLFGLISTAAAFVEMTVVFGGIAGKATQITPVLLDAASLFLAPVSSLSGREGLRAECVFLTTDFAERTLSASLLNSVCPCTRWDILRCTWIKCSIVR